VLDGFLIELLLEVLMTDLTGEETAAPINTRKIMVTRQVLEIVLQEHLLAPFFEL
jgi:hypothetical protein